MYVNEPFSLLTFSSTGNNRFSIKIPILSLHFVHLLVLYYLTMPSAHHPLVVGLTGNIGTGKSTVLRYLAQKGAHIVDADQLTHRAQSPEGPAYPAIVATFGKEILNEDGTINRAALGKIVFSDPQKLAKLEQIVHPAVFQLAQEEIANSPAPVVILEAIKLLEANNVVKLCHKIWVITASEEKQLERLMANRGMSEAEALRRMTNQSSQEEKVKRADRVINNDGTPEELYKQLDRIWTEIQAVSYGHTI